MEDRPFGEILGDRFVKGGNEQANDVYEVSIPIEELQMLQTGGTFERIIGIGSDDEIVDIDFRIIPNQGLPISILLDLESDLRDLSSGLLTWDSGTGDFTVTTAASIVSGYLLADGSVVITGALNASVDDAIDLGLAVRRFATLHATAVDAGADPLVLGGSEIDASSLQIVNLADPTAAQHAATKTYVDTEIDTDIATHAAETSVHGISPFGETLVDDADAAAARTTLELGDSATLDVGTGSGDVAAGDHTHTLADVTDSGDLAALDTVGTAQIDNDAITNAKIDAGAVDTTELATDAVETAKIVDGAVTLAKMADLPGLTFLGNATVFSTAPQALTASQMRSGLDVPDTNVLDWIAVQERPWWGIGTVGWNTSSSGSGASYITTPRFASGARVDGWAGGYTMDTGTGTSGTNARCSYPSATATLWAHPLFRIAIRFFTANSSELEIVRFGFWGGGSNPSTTGRPTDGFALEFDRSLDATNVELITCSGGSTTRSSSASTALPGGTLTGFELVYVTTASVALYAVSSTGAATLIANNVTNVPSGNNPQSGNLFVQVEKINPASASRGQAIFDVFVPIVVRNRPHYSAV